MHGIPPKAQRVRQYRLDTAGPAVVARDELRATGADIPVIEPKPRVELRAARIEYIRAARWRKEGEEGNEDILHAPVQPGVARARPQITALLVDPE